MQAVILTAGRGTRMGELTKNTQKSMLIINGKPFLAYVIESLPSIIDEVIIVIGFCGEQVQNFFGDEWGGKKIKYVIETNYVSGTAASLWKAKNLLHDNFAVMNGDDLFLSSDIEACVRQPWSLSVLHKANMHGGGLIKTKDGMIEDIVESDDHGGVDGMVAAGLYAMDMRIFDHPLVPKAHGSSEMGLPQTLLMASRSAKIPLNLAVVAEVISISQASDMHLAEKRIKQIGGDGGNRTRVQYAA